MNQVYQTQTSNKGFMLQYRFMQKIGFRQSRSSIENYFLWRAERALPAVRTINKIKRIKGKHILDIGCGYGSLSSLLLKRGATVTATEVENKKLEFAKKKLGSSKNISFVKVEDERLPFPDNSFDIVTLFDVIEHVKTPELLMSEVTRVLKPKGLLYVEFTPFYSITGHHLYDYTILPIHLLTPWLIKDMIAKKNVKSFQTKNDFWELYLSLNKIKIGQFEKMVHPLSKLEEKYIIKYPDVFTLNLPFLRFLGPLKDFFTMSFEGIYLKK